MTGISTTITHGGTGPVLTIMITQAGVPAIIIMMQRVDAVNTMAAGDIMIMVEPVAMDRPPAREATARRAGPLLQAFPADRA